MARGSLPSHTEARVTPEYRTFVEELFAGLAPIRIRRVFNFDGLYRGEVMFGLVAEERIYLKTDETSRNLFVREGAGPLYYRARDGTVVPMSYYELPARLCDAPDEAVVWARVAYEIAVRSPTALRKQRKQSAHVRGRQPARRRKR